MESLREFYEAYISAYKHYDHMHAHYSVAWHQDFSLTDVLAATRAAVRSLYNPQNNYKIWGFKEVRYEMNYEGLTKELSFIKTLFSNTKIILLTRRLEDVSKSAWWPRNPNAVSILSSIESNFDKYHINNPEFTLRVTYEDIVAGKIDTICKFLGVPFDKKYLDPLSIRTR